MKTKTGIRIILVSLAAVFLISGCGYQMGSLYPQNVKTVFVPVWTRGADVYRRQHEMQLTEAIIKRIQLDTPYKIAPLETADTKLTGKIETISQQVLTRDTDTGLSREREVTFTVSFTWTDLRSGDVIVEKKNFKATGRYISQDPINEEFFEGAQEAINEAAKRIVEQLESQW